ncbi:hypothetical protein BOTBODRAFT_117501, partial [Botryobasidium botryosum FD-172 SS1]
LHMRPNTYTINLGNDRPNLCMKVLPMRYSRRSLGDIVKQLTPPPGEDIESTMIFCNTRRDCHAVQCTLQRSFPDLSRSKVVVYHAARTESAKRDVMEKLMTGDIKILICTEAAGMGADIPNIKKVIQLGVLSSLSIWIQRAGCAGQTRNLLADAILLVPPSFYNAVSAQGPMLQASQLRKKRTKMTDSEQG